MSERKTMGGKPVFTTESRIINFKSGFDAKLLCDTGTTFTAGTACQYSCSFCYVPAVMAKAVNGKFPHKHEDMVIRRANAVKVLRGQLTDSKGNPKFLDKNDRRVIYGSPLVDVASNMELVNETIELCHEIMSLTNWDIRLLSKSNLLPKIAEGLSSHHWSQDRVIYGVSTGTLNDRLAKAFEQGCPLVSKRIQSLHWLQDNGFRTFGMICPSLPQANYSEFAQEMSEAIRVDKCEHIWAEVINTRGESFNRTFSALVEAGFLDEANRLSDVSHNKTAWEFYARATFLAEKCYIPANKLRFLQYVNNSNREWWKAQVPYGAVLL